MWLTLLIVIILEIFRWYYWIVFPLITFIVISCCGELPAALIISGALLVILYIYKLWKE